jgi:hypothetical protein
LASALAKDECPRWLNGITQTLPEFLSGLDRFLLFVRREYQFVLATFAASCIGYLGSAPAGFPMLSLCR